MEKYFIIFQNEIEEKNKINLIDVIGNSIDILCHELENYEIEGADYLIKINTKNISLLDKTKIDYLYQLGYIETKKRIKKLMYKMYLFTDVKKDIPKESKKYPENSRYFFVSIL